ncbi:hypothetical protein [Suilimivivens sp.]|mgnify:CR=1 FL=1|uniref:hypothetical protein n=1 Tax=Suilimivivens sp. TaxID=2981669 RepID=UPI00307717E5
MENVKETKIKICIEGYEEYKEKMQEMKNAVVEYREEIDRANNSLQRQIELIRELKQLAKGKGKKCLIQWKE